MALTGAQRQKKWRDANRELWNLRRRNLRKGSSLVEKEPERESTAPRIEMSLPENPPPRPSVSELREMMAKASEKPVTEPPVSAETRSAKDVVGGIYRNDNGGVISKFAWEKLQKMKEHAKENNFEIDEYSQ